MKFFHLLSLTTILASCSSMHMKMDSAYESPKGKGKVTFEKTYDLASFPYICGATAIFFGGGCWAYLAMPMVPQEQEFLDDAKKSLKEKLGTDDVTFIEPEVRREHWHAYETKLEITQ